MRIQKLPSAASSQLTISSTARKLQDFIALADAPTSTGFEFNDGANFAEISVQSGSIRYMVDGNTPTSSLGTLVKAGSSFSVMPGTLDKLKLIRAGSSDAVVNVVRSGQVNAGEMVEATPRPDGDSASLVGPGNPVIDSYATIPINLTTGANQVLVSSAANKQIWVYGYALTCGDADGQSVSLQDEDDTALSGIMEFGQYGGISVPPSGNFAMPVFKLDTNKDLEIDITGGDVDGWLSYAIVSV